MVKGKSKGKGGGNTSPFFHSKYFYWGLLIVVLFLAYWQKSPCFTGSWAYPEAVQYSKLCYSDLQALYGYRGLEQRKIPYVEQKPFEYPPLIGYQMYLSALFSKSHVEFFKVNAVINGLWAILTLWILSQLVGYNKQLLWFVAVPPLIYHLHLNWDISSVALLSIAMLFWERRKYLVTGCAIGIGFTGKMFPVFVLPFIALSLFKEGDNFRRKILAGVAGALIGVALMNLPIVFLDFFLNKNFTAVLGVFGFHAVRTPDFGTMWYWLAPIFGADPTSQDYTHKVDRFFLLSMAVFALLLLRRQWKREVNVWQQAGAVTALCLCISKVHSPQYSLWMLPFFVRVTGSGWARLFYLFGDLLVFICGFQWFAHSKDLGPHYFRDLFVMAVFIRALGLAWIALNWGFGKRSK